MKIEWNNKYTTIATYVFIVACSVILFYLSLSQLGMVLSKISGAIGILQPFIMGFSIAYILNFILKFFENKVINDSLCEKIRLKSKSRRAISIFITYVVTFLIMYLFIIFVLPQLVDSIVGLVNDVPMYINETTKFINDTLTNLNIGKEYMVLINDNFNKFIEYVIKFASNLLPVLGTAITSVASSIWNIILGLIISIYLLIDKQFYQALLQKKQ